MTDSRVGRGLVLFVLLLIPFLGGACLLDFVETVDWKRQRENHLARLQNLVARFERNVRPAVFFQEALERFKRAIPRGGMGRNVLSSGTFAPLSLYVFSGVGKRVSMPGCAEGVNAASERCLALVKKTVDEGNQRLSLRDRKLAESFFGTFAAIAALAAHPNELQSLEQFGVERSAGIFSCTFRDGSKGSIIAILDHRRISGSYLRETVRKRLARRSDPDCLFGCGELVGGGLISAAMPEEIRRHLKSGDGRNHFQDQGMVWCFAVVDRQDLVFCRAPAIPDLPPFLERHRGSSMALLLLFLLLFGGMQISGRWEIPIRLRTGFLFAVSSFACLAVALGFGGLAVDAQRESLIRGRFDDACGILAKADNSYADFLHSLERRYTRLVKRITTRPVERGDVARAAVSLGRLERNLSVVVVATSGAIIYAKESPVDGVWEDLMGEEFLTTLGAMSRQAMRQCTHEIASGTLQPDEDVVQISAIVRHGSDAMYGKSGLLTTQQFDKKELTWYFNFIRDTRGFPVATVLIAHPHNFLENVFVRWLVRSRRLASRTSPFDFRLFSVFGSGEIANSGVSARLPRALIRTMNDSIIRTRAPVMRMVELHGKPRLIVGNPGLHLTQQNLFMVCSIGDISREAARLRTGLAVFSLLVLIFAASLAVLFARTLLEPMGRITNALQRLSASDFRFRMHVPTGDEFETIGEGLQQTLEELKDLSVARSIQENLLPAGPLVTERFIFRGWTRSASEIGGEIFDFQQLDDGRLVLWLAGAPGHSISSALLLGMYKMAVRLLLTLAVRKPHEVIAELSASFRGRVLGLETGPLILGILDPRSGRLSMASREGGTVVVVRNDGTVTSFPISDLSLAAGDRVYLLSITISAAEAERLVAEKLVAEAGMLTAEEAGPRILERVFAGMAPDAAHRTRTLLAIEAVKE